MSYRRQGSEGLDDPLVVRYLEFVEGRARRNTVLAVKSDLGIFLSFAGKDPTAVKTDDVLRFVADQRAPRFDGKVVRLADGESGLMASTIKRRLSSVAGFYSFLVMIEAVDRNPVPIGIATRRPVRHRRSRVPLVRTPRLLPKILEPVEVNLLFRALRRVRDRAMVEAMVLGGLRRCEVLGLRLGDLRPAERRVMVADGKGGHQRMVSISPRFFRSVSIYMQTERPDNTATDRVFVVLKGSRRGKPLSEDGLEEIIRAARARAGLAHATCHELRHTCFTRLREAGMALEAIQAQAGHRSIETTRLYLHLSNDWLADEYQRAAELIDVSMLQTVAR
ncbi:MAG TPA: tyrosine-type recombinase/integrase [Acidimicrobiales bacterium]|nr:tyrosine-type recombinase/integrase [Acidimicrobiales bacterium]